ncbi:hypothetical protein SOVF_142300 [Spinacia oleracea]|nr:hypothetical protein SOVF_142300 [Spinacia oleracea]
MAKETEIKSAIQELSLINKLINNGNGDSSSPSSVVAATVVVAAVSEQQRRVLSYIPTSSFLSLCTLIVQVLEPRANIEQIVGNSYEMTLKPWHGWISATAYKVALKLLPDTNTLISLLMGKGDNFDTLRDEIQVLLSLLVPLLQQLHSTLVTN